MKLYYELRSKDELLDILEECVSARNYTGLCDFGETPSYVVVDTELRTIDEIYPFEKIPAGCLQPYDHKVFTDTVDGKIIARFNAGKLEWSLMDFESMKPMIEVLMYGAQKYDADNWKKACPTKASLLNSLERHFIELKEQLYSEKNEQGHCIDSESHLRHIGHLMCNAMFYAYWEKQTNGQFENFVSK